MSSKYLFNILLYFKRSKIKTISGFSKVQYELAYAKIEGGQTESSSTFTFVDDLYINIRSGNFPTLQNYCVFYWPEPRRNFYII